MAQLDSEFNEWWDGIKETLDDNVVTNLQQQIDELKEKVDSDSALMGLLTKPVYDKFKTGDFGIAVKTSDLKIGGKDFPKLGSEIPDTCSYKYPVSGLLPDGKVFCVMCVCDANANGNLIGVFLQNTDGVVTKKIVSLADDYDIYVNSGYNGFNYMGGDVTSYPAVFYVSYIGDRRSGHGVLAKITIYESGTIGIEVYEIEATLASGSNRGNGSMMTSPTSNKSYITTFWDIDSRYPMQILKVNSSGVYTTHKIEMPVSNPRTDRYNDLGSWDYIFGYDNYWILRAGYGFVSSSGDYYDKRPTKYMYFKITEDDLTVSQIDSGPDSLIDYFPEYGFEIYSLSESSGLQSNTINPGTDITPVLSKISDYFVGASNLGGTIPEGSYIATKIDNSYYGTGPSGESIGIGENGGAAILKKKMSSVSVDISKATTYLPGFVQTESGAYYLLYEIHKNYRFSSTPTAVVHRIYIGG